MTVIVSQNPVVDATAGAVIDSISVGYEALETAQIEQDEMQTARIDYMGCIQKIKLCIAQGADKTFQLIGPSTDDYSSATEITFDVWESVNGGASVLSKSLTGASLTLLNDYTIQFDISNSESGALSRGNKHCEAWITLSGGDRRCVGAGIFQVQDTRKFD